MKCQLCQREKDLTFHHLIPRTLHSNKWFKKRYTKKEMSSRGIYVCQDCHDNMHKTYDEKTLGRLYNTLELLLNDPKIIKFSKWISSK